MYYYKYVSNGDDFLVLEPEDWSEDEWKTILKLIGAEEAERLVVRDYILECYGTPKPNLSDLIKKQKGE